MLKRTTKYVQVRGKEADDREGHYEEEPKRTLRHLICGLMLNTLEIIPNSLMSTHTIIQEGHINDKDGAPKKGRNRGQGKGRGRTLHQQENRGHHMGTPLSNNMVSNEQQISAKQPPGPRMPDVTRGFVMGRGKPGAVNDVTSAILDDKYNLGLTETFCNSLGAVCSKMKYMRSINLLMNVHGI